MNYDLDTKKGMASAIQWTQGLIDSLNENGQWFIPRSGTTVQFNKAERKATIHSLIPDESVGRVLKAMGWEVTVHE